MMLNEFEVRSYGWQELAVLYGPDLMPASAIAYRNGMQE